MHYIIQCSSHKLQSTTHDSVESMIPPGLLEWDHSFLKHVYNDNKHSDLKNTLCTVQFL